MEGSDNPITSEQPCQASIPLFGSDLGEGATCFSGEGEFGRGDLGGLFMYEFVMVAF